MAVAAMVTGTQATGPEALTAAAVSAVQAASPSASPSSATDHLSNMSAKSSSASEKPAARIDDSPSPSVGLAAAAAEHRAREGEVEVYCEGLVRSRFGGHARYRKTPPPPWVAELREGWRR
jgi:hypothetical protein